MHIVDPGHAFYRIQMLSTLREVLMITASPFDAGLGSLAAADRPLLQKGDTLAHQVEGKPTFPISERIHMVWPIVTIALGGVLTLGWLIFLVWAAFTIVTLLT
jgi:hypothetical protein